MHLGNLTAHGNLALRPESFNELRQRLDQTVRRFIKNNEKVDIESLLSGKIGKFSVKTTEYIYRLFEKYGFDEVFGRSTVMGLLELKGSGASKFLSNLVQADIIQPVSGYGKGKYKFKR